MAVTLYNIKQNSVRLIFLVSLGAIWLTNYSSPALSTPVCTITNYKNTVASTDNIPHLQWRRCFVAGKALYYIRVFINCETGICNLGWERAKRFGQHYISTYDTEQTKRTMQIHFPDTGQLNINIRNQDKVADKTDIWKLAFREESISN